ncbi:glycosyltransferase [Vibrio sp. 1640]|uniref:glycosyltransferase n=1 Tax=Vibrio sp. 1640 TaxID=3074570 RepID=UPI0029641784|nr:glycosyltransferase [Vibrio sp. 1640]MDW2080741.1 glycosyltransferase [Vibrio sp. 1640]
MRVVHVFSGSPSGGAAKGALNLHHALLENGVDSIILNDVTKEREIGSKICRRFSKLYRLIRLWLDRISFGFISHRQIFSGVRIGVDISDYPEVITADIIHLHWINAGFVSISSLTKIKKPIVWTVRDMWPITGGCHYSLSCESFRKQCLNCSKLPYPQKIFMTKDIFSVKKSAYECSNIVFVPISKWMDQQIKLSGMGISKKIHYIPNCISVTSFDIRTKLSNIKGKALRDDRFVVLLGAADPEDIYKGFDLFFDSLKYLNLQQFTFIFFGGSKSYFSELDLLGVDYISVGYVDNDEYLSQLYSTADVFLSPSRAEAFGKTAAESMACGTPVVAFDKTGASDIVVHKQNGYLAKAFSSEDLANGLYWIKNYESQDPMAIRSSIVDRFNSSMISNEYIALYNRLTERANEN